jgi:hypothetical protein
MHRLVPDHLPGLIAAFDGAAASSYVCLASVHGYSASELCAAWDQGSAAHFADDPAAPRLLLSVDGVDRAHGHARVQFFGGPASAPLAGFVAGLRAALGVDRLCSYIFASETREAELLRGLGFAEEALFREHVYLNGAYRDVVVYGCNGAQR